MEHPGLMQGLDISTQFRQVPRQYGEWQVYNSEGTDCPNESLVEVIGTCAGDGTAGKSYFKIAKPTQDSATAVLVAPWGVISHKVGTATMDDRFAGVVIAYDGADPAVGDTLGTQTGSWKAKVGNTGFIALAVNTTDKLAYCRAASAGGGGSASLTVVQATSDGAAGVIPVKVITMKADPAASPNFEQAATGSNVNYYKL